MDMRIHQVRWKGRAARGVGTSLVTVTDVRQDNVAGDPRVAGYAGQPSAGQKYANTLVFTLYDFSLDH